MRVAAVVLAAGASSRLGRPKQLVRVEGRTLVRRTVDAVRRAGCSPVVVVLGAVGELLAPELAGTEAVTITNSDWRSGMASSVRAGIGELRGHSGIDAALLVPCDLPRLDAGILRSLIERFEAAHAADPAAVAACAYGGTVGAPALFGRSAFDALESLRGEGGARELLRTAGPRLVQVEWPDGAIDLDRPGDLEGAGL